MEQMLKDKEIKVAKFGLDNHTNKPSVEKIKRNRGTRNNRREAFYIYTKAFLLVYW